MNLLNRATTFHRFEIGQMERLMINASSKFKSAIKSLGIDQLIM